MHPLRWEPLASQSHISAVAKACQTIVLCIVYMLEGHIKQCHCSAMQLLFCGELSELTGS